MADVLRHISVHVEEAGPGAFHWVLMETRGDPLVHEQIGVSPEPFGRWIDALTAGVDFLIKLAPDERIGPRTIDP